MAFKEGFLRVAPASEPLPPRLEDLLVDAAYEKRSVAISSNLHPAAC